MSFSQCLCSTGNSEFIPHIGEELLLDPEITYKFFGRMNENQGWAGKCRKVQMLKNRADSFWATLGEGGLVLAIAAIGWATNQPLIFASLGPTAYELVEQPRLPSARTYN